jgi:7-cyano-7-deazaguanine reductase
MTEPPLPPTFPNPRPDVDYQIRFEHGELTFFGARDQPDFADLTIVYVPADTIFELKGLKKWVQSFRDSRYSYERLANVMYDALFTAAHPRSLVVMMACHIRGGTKTTIYRSSNQNLADLAFGRPTDREERVSRV